MSADNADPDRSDELQLCSIVSARELGVALTALLRRDARRRHGPEQSRRRLAAAVGCSTGSLTAYFKGDRVPREPLVLDNLVAVLGASAEEKKGFAEAWERAKRVEQQQKAAPEPAQKPTRRRWLIPAAVVAGAVGLGAAAAYASAQLGPVNPHCKQTCVFYERDVAVPVRSDSRGSAPVVANVPNKAAVQLVCWVDDGQVGRDESNYASARWFRVVYTASSGESATGYVHSAMVFEQPHDRPHC